MQSAQWIERASKALGEPTARELAKRIGINEATLSQHKSGKAKTLNDDHCMVVAEICGIDPAIVIADQQAERASPAVRRIYERLGKLVMQGAAVVLATACLGVPEKAAANQSISTPLMRVVCILC